MSEMSQQDAASREPGPLSGSVEPRGTLGPTQATALIVGSIIGVGIFNLPGSLAAYGPISLFAMMLTTVGALALAVIGGVLKRDLDLDDPSSLLLEYLDPDEFLLTPLPNHLFQRDNTAWVYDGLTINPMSKPARKRETINSRLVFNYHPTFRDADPQLHFYYGNDSEFHDPANCEGGTSWSSATAR